MSARIQLRILHGAHFACHFFLLIFPTAAIAIAAEAGGGYAAALALGTPLYAAFALATLPAGWLADRLDGGLLIAVFFLGCGAASLLAGLAPGETALMAALALLGLFAALYHPVGLALLTRLAERPGRTLAVNGVFGNLGLAGAALVTGVTADLAGWRAAFALPGLVALAAGAASLAALRRMPASGRAARPLPHAAPAVPGAA
ncbi:MFS transporter, partial [Aquibium sp. A9E412]|uniref:MFS transporter n=1 Tax=Aquibium sp. A9E412 TaxID=2976767 RepID=UPI0025B22D20